MVLFTTLARLMVHDLSSSCIAVPTVSILLIYGYWPAAHATRPSLLNNDALWQMTLIDMVLKQIGELKKDTGDNLNYMRNKCYILIRPSSMDIYLSHLN